VPRTLNTIWLALAALLGLSPAVSACPYCALSQGTDTLVFILLFLVIPYLVVSAVWFWMKRVLAAEKAEKLEQEAAARALERAEPAPRAS